MGDLKMKKLMVICIILIITSTSWAIDLVATGTYLGESEDAHWVNIQGEIYTLDIESSRFLNIQRGSLCILKFSINEDGQVIGIEIIDAREKR